MALTSLLKVFHQSTGERSPEDIRILDHGCGGGLKALYIAALGYPNVYGVNVNANIEHLNNILREIFGITEPRFVTTDGRELPFPDGTFDFILSCQVLEHLNDDVVELYYSEEGRVLREGGVAYHEVPHLFVPYDSHSRLWFAHWSPRVLKPAVYGIMKTFQQRKMMLQYGSLYARQHSGGSVRLRSPMFHRRQLLKHIGPYQDLTVDRLLNQGDFTDYDRDAPLGVRMLVDRLVKMPVIGSLVLPVLRNMVMLQTFATKSREGVSQPGE